MMEGEVFASVRVYDGIDPADLAELERVTIEGFVPIISGSEGFIAYYVVHPVDGTLAAINVFETREQALASNALARDFVVEYLAPLLPNPPRIVEGLVDIGFVEMLDGMADGDVSSLHASVRIYDGFEADDLNEFVNIVEDGFLPIMRETDGFFGYYLMHDGADQLAAISIFDSETSAMASNSAAADFVAENLTQYLPTAPSITAGRVAIALLADVNNSANLIDQSVFASVRVYDGVNPADQDDIVRLTSEGFLPIMRGSDGFVGYYLLPAGDTLAAVSLFDSPEQASASNEKARDFVAENLAPLLPNPPLIVAGELDVWHLASLEDMMMGASPSSLYAALRVYDNYDLTNREEAVELVDTIFLPQQQEADGLFSYFTMDDGVDRVAALSVYDSEANALAANDLAAEFTAEYMTDWISEEPTRINGSLGLAAFAELNAGANLIDSKQMEDKVFASVRVYDDINPADQDDIVRLTSEGFLPIMRESDGFVGYYLLPAGDRLAAVSLFDSAGQASASNAKARDFVVENLAPLLPNPPTIVEGEIDISTQMMVDFFDESMAPEDMALPLYAALRIYSNYDMTFLDEANHLVETILLPAQMETGGLFAYFSMNDGVDMVVGFSVFATEEGAQTANEIAASFVAEHLADVLPDDPVRINGRLGIAVREGVLAGVNAAEKEMPMKRVFASVRVYDGIDPADQDNIVRLTSEGFLPIMRGSDGFVGYYLLPAGDTLAAISLFDSAEQASASTEKAREFVAENLAPLLPNPPTIVEGTVEVTYLTDTQGVMMDAGMTSLHALLAIYDGFDIAHLDETVALVQSVFLPDLRENGGLFSYYGISDGVDKAVALRIMDSEESLQGGSDIAADFVAEHLADWLPDDPLQVSGSLGVAALADVHMGANLVGAMMDDSVFASVRVYNGIDPADQDDIARLTAEGFLPIMRGSDGFVGYYLLPAGDMLTAVSLFDSAEQASASTEKAREFVAENLAPLLPNPPTVVESPLSINHVAALRRSDDLGAVGELYASIRFYEGFDLTHFAEANDLAISQLLPALKELGGLFAQFALNDGEDTVVGISIFSSEEASLAANDAGKAFTMEYLADWAPNPPTGVAGKLAIAAQAEINMGENLVRAMMEG